VLALAMQDEALAAGGGLRRGGVVSRRCRMLNTGKDESGWLPIGLNEALAALRQPAYAGPLTEAARGHPRRGGLHWRSFAGPDTGAIQCRPPAAPRRGTQLRVHRRGNQARVQGDPGTAARIAQYAQIIAFRNILIHGFDLVDPALVWSTVQTQSASLPRDVQAMLAQRP